jgi:transcription elongation factor
MIWSSWSRYSLLTSVWRLSHTTSSNQTVGVIFKTERDSFRVLDQNGQVRLVQPHQISMRRDSNRAIATDAEGYELRVGDNMKENDGEVRKISLCYNASTHICLDRVVKVAFFTFTNPSSHSCTIVR